MLYGDDNWLIICYNFVFLSMCILKVYLFMVYFLIVCIFCIWRIWISKWVILFSLVLLLCCGVCLLYSFVSLLNFELGSFVNCFFLVCLVVLIFDWCRKKVVFFKFVLKFVEGIFWLRKFWLFVYVVD